MNNLAVQTWLRFLIWMILGLVVSWFYGRKHAPLGQAEPKTTEPTSTMKP